MAVGIGAGVGPSRRGSPCPCTGNRMSRRVFGGRLIVATLTFLGLIHGTCCKPKGPVLSPKVGERPRIEIQVRHPHSLSCPSHISPACLIFRVSIITHLLVLKRGVRMLHRAIHQRPCPLTNSQSSRCCGSLRLWARPRRRFPTRPTCGGCRWPTR
jgi:hypothetical protein